MLLTIDDSQLEARIMRHRGQIGTRGVVLGILDFVAGISYVATAFTTGFPLPVQLVLAGLGLFPTCYGGWSIYDSCCHGYDADDLLEEIRAMDRTIRRSSIIAVKDPSQKMSNRFLVYRDTGWDCDFFPNHATRDVESANVAALADYFSATFRIPLEDFVLHHVADEVSSKPSAEHDNEVRDYQYSLYRAEVVGVPEGWSADRFAVGGVQCKWLTVDEMLADRHTREINSDVLSMVKKYL